MKLFLFFCFVLLFGWLASKVNPQFRTGAKKLTPNFTDTINFTSRIQPILEKNCSPCHFPGGKMYEKMPFDKDTTIINHKEGILKRIKGDENALLNAFIRQRKDDN